jgi:hypothetical protein
MLSERSRWIVRIKSLREQHGFSILEAERMALADPVWRRWVEHQINHDVDCRKMAIRHIRHHGDDALVCQNRGRFSVA